MSYLIGELLAGRYRVDAYLGEGGMAQVYKAWDSERAAPVALKMLRADLAQDPVFLRRFRREAVMLERLQHPNIVRTYGFEQDDLLAFIVMDYISGSNLRTEIFRRQGKPLAMERILDILRPTCGALHYAHRSGIAHCDVKPANILSEESGRILLSDFGVARTHGERHGDDGGIPGHAGVHGAGANPWRRCHTRHRYLLRGCGALRDAQRRRAPLHRRARPHHRQHSRESALGAPTPGSPAAAQAQP